jgi:hypothetical protein
VRSSCRFASHAPNASGGTHVTLVHRNIGDGPLWARYRAYFEDAWSGVLAACKQAAER